MQIFSKIYRPESSIPHPSVISHNLNSLSAYSIHKARKIAIIKTIRRLTALASIVFLQETHLHFFDKDTLKTEFPRHKMYYNNFQTTKTKSKARAGTIIMIHESITNHYDILAPPPLSPRLHSADKATAQEWLPDAASEPS